MYFVVWKKKNNFLLCHFFITLANKKTFFFKNLSKLLHSLDLNCVLHTMLHSIFPSSHSFPINICWNFEECKILLCILNFWYKFPFEKVLHHKCIYLIGLLSYTQCFKTPMLHSEKSDFFSNLKITRLSYSYNSTHFFHIIRCESSFFCGRGLIWRKIHLRGLSFTQNFH